MCQQIIKFKMDSSCQKQVPPTIRTAPIGDSNSKIAATILDHATDESQGIELLQLDPQTMKSVISEFPSLIQTNEPLLSHRPLLAATVADGDHSGVDQDSRLDRGSASSFIDQSIVDHKIQTSVITPMDRVIIAQTLHNPHPDYKEEIITVQIVYQHLQINDGTNKKDKRPQSLTKNFKHPLEMHNSYENGFKWCKLCLDPIEKMEKHYNCKEKACQEINNSITDFQRVGPCTCCAKCMLSFELRRQLEDKTTLQNLVQLYYLGEKGAQQDLTKQQGSNLKNEKIDQKIISVQEMPILRDTKDPYQENISQKSKHAIIGLWRRNNLGYNECYRQFRIDHPVTKKRFMGGEYGGPGYADVYGADFKLEHLFYVGDKGGLFYFTQTQTLDHLGAKKKEFYLQQFDIAQACRIKIDSIKMRLYTRNLYFPPIIREKQAVGNIVDNLITSPFFQSPVFDELSPFDPQFFESAGYLALTVDKAVPLNDISSNNLVETKYNNIFFCRLDQPSKIDKIIFNGCVVLKVNVTLNKISDVWYSCDKSLNQIQWKNEIDPSQLTRAFLKEKSPEQKLTSCYTFSGRTADEDNCVKQNLNKYLYSKHQCTQVLGVIHNNDQRVSFVFTNTDFMTFEINKETNKAVLVLGNHYNSDSRFFFSKDGSLLMCFGINHEEAQEKDLNSIKIDFGNLDAKKPDQSSNVIEQDYKIRDLQIEFKIDDHLFDNRLPYQFTDFRTQIKDGKQEFTAFLHFVDSDTYQQNFYFLKGKKIGLGDNEEFTSQTFVRKQAATEYPILIQNTDLPLQNQLLVANLSLNEPQKLIDLGDYRFICFVEIGLQEFVFLNRDYPAVGIFFLALSPNGHINLMKFRIYPWLFNERNTNEIEIFSGFIAVSKLTQLTKIKGAALLFHYGYNDAKLLIKIVIQFQQDIKVYSLTDPEYLKQLNPIEKNLEERNAKLHMVCSRNMIFYVKRCGTTEDKIICVHHTGPDITEQVFYTSYFQILQLQAKQDGVPTQNEQSLYIIDNQSRFIEIKCNLKNLNFEVFTVVSMKNAEQIIHKLNYQKWQKLALSQRSVTASLLIKEDNYGGWKGAITYNLTSGSIFQHDFLGYKADVKITNTFGVSAFNLTKNCLVFSVQHLAGIGKILLTVQEGNFCYYLLMQSVDNRRIDLLSHQPDNRFIFDGIKLCGNTIITNICEQSLIFGHNDLMQKYTQPFYHHQLANDCKIQEQIQSNYLLRFKKTVDKETNNTQNVDMIVRSNSYGGFTTIYSSLKNYIGKQRTAINNQLKQEFKGEAGEAELCLEPDPSDYPVYFVTSKGTLVLSFNLAQSKKKESDNAVNGKNKKVSEKEQTFQIVKYNMQYENENLEILNEGVNDLTEDEKKVVIYVIKSDTLKTNPLYFKQTTHFLVILEEHKIFFKKLGMINNQKQKVDLERMQKYKAFSQQKGLSSQKIREFNNFQGLTTQIESKECCYEFECIDLSQLFTEKEQQGNYKVTVMQGKQPFNVIQISFVDIIVLWDLEKNQELSSITDFDQFSTPETMIPSPFQFRVEFETWQSFSFLIEQTHDQNIFFYRCEKHICLFKMFTMLDLLEIQAIHKSLKKQGGFKYSTPIDSESVLAFFNGKTFFQLFRENPEVIHSFLKQLKEQNLPKFINEHGVESDNIYVRRLFRTLKSQTTVEDENQESLIFKRYQLKVFAPPKLSGLSIFQEQLKYDSNLMDLDTLLEIVLFSSEVDISIMITDFEYFSKVIDIQSSWVSTFMKKVFKTNAQTEEVYNMPWDEKQKIVVFTANNSQLSCEQIKKLAQIRMRTQTKVRYLHARLIELINKYNKCKKLEPPTFNFKLVPVTVKIIEISWLTREELKDFYLFVACSNNESFYDLELIRVLLTSQDYGMQLIYRVFFPYIILMGAVLYYFGVCVNVPHSEGFFGGEAVGLRCFIFAYQLLFCGVEVKQMYNLKGYYWNDPWNFVYLLQYALNYLVIIQHSTSWFGLDHSQLTQFTACSTISLWTILFYWMRIFDDLGFYVYLIIETIKDTKSFLILVLMVLVTFANALYILEVANHPSAAVSDDTALTLPTKDGDGEIQRLIQRAYNVTFIDSVVNQYLLGLGEFQYDAFASSPSGPLIWSLFLFSTFLTQVTFMNMLIAIMSNTFSRVLESQEKYGLQQKTMITADFIYALSLSEMITEKRYLYIIEPANTSKSQDAIESSIENLKKSLASENTKHSQLIREETHKATSGMLTQVQLISKQMTKLSQEIKGQSREETQRDHITVSKRPTLPRQKLFQGKDSKVESLQKKIGMDAKVDALTSNMDALRQEITTKVDLDAFRQEFTTKADALREQMSAKVETLTAKVDAQAKQMTAIQDLLQKLINQRLN